MQVSEILYSKGYRLGPRIGKGSYAKVKVAERLSDNRILAAKIVSRRRNAKEFLSKFLPRELSVLLSVDHRNIIRVYEIVQTEELVCVVMEYASRGDLLDYIKKRGALLEDEAGILFAQVCEGVKYLHDRNICHRDLKCENILLRRNMTVALSDFGFSRRLPSQDTISSTYCGSAAYASPELLRGTPYKPLENDMWSLGCILFIMMTGQMPFCDKNTKKMMYRQLKGKVNFPENRTVSQTCKSLIAQMLEPNTDLRYDIKEVLEHIWLQHFLVLLRKTVQSPSEQLNASSDSTRRYSELINSVREKAGEADKCVTTSSDASKADTEKGDAWNRSICNNFLTNQSSTCSNDSANENMSSFVQGNASLCRMPGEACLFRVFNEHELLVPNKHPNLKQEDPNPDLSSSSCVKRNPSESSVATNRSNSPLVSSTSIDPNRIPDSTSEDINNVQHVEQQTAKDSGSRPGNRRSDSNFKIRIQQILHVPVNKTCNSRSFQDHTVPGCIVCCDTGNGLEGSQNSESVNLAQSVSMTQLRRLTQQTATHKSTSTTSNSGSEAKPHSHNVGVQQTYVSQAGLVTQMRRIFESKNTNISTNDRSP